MTIPAIPSYGAHEPTSDSQRTPTNERLFCGDLGNEVTDDLCGAQRINVTFPGHDHHESDMIQP